MPNFLYEYFLSSSKFPPLTLQLKEERQNLTTKNEALQAELDFTQNQLSGKKAQVHTHTHTHTHILHYLVRIHIH